jgi:NTE family protein
MQPNRSEQTRGRRWWNLTKKLVPRARFVPSALAPPRIGLALGGGFARGIAHIGVLRVFERNNIPIHCVAGISAGSMVAAAFAGGCSVSEIEKVAASMRFRDVARWTLSRRGLAGTEPMIVFLNRFLKHDRFEDLKTPLAIIATDLTSGDPVVFRGKGDVVLPIRASCSYPGLFLPIKYGGHCLVDGGVSMDVPTKPLRDMGATRVIAVQLPAPSACPDPSSIFAVVNRCFQVMGARLENEWRKYTDLVITPAVGDMAWDSFENAGTMIELGEKAALAALPTIKQWLKPFERASDSPRLAFQAT